MIYHSQRGRTYEPGSAYGTFDDLAEAVLDTVRALEPVLHTFDVIAVQGTSGMSVGFPVALKLGKPICVVRKPGEDNHCGSEVITGLGSNAKGLTGKSVLFVDDFVSLGGTRTRVREAVEAEGGRLVAQYMARDGYATL